MVGEKLVIALDSGHSGPCLRLQMGRWTSNCVGFQGFSLRYLNDLAMKAKIDHWGDPEAKVAEILPSPPLVGCMLRAPGTPIPGMHRNREALSDLWQGFFVVAPSEGASVYAGRGPSKDAKCPH